MISKSLKLALTAVVFFVAGGCGEEEEPTGAEKYGEDIQSVRLMIFRDGSITRALAEYRMMAGKYPTTEQGLKALYQRPKGVKPDEWSGPYVDGPEAYSDKWGNELHYRYPSKVYPDKKNAYDVWSLGPDGTDGTDDDILNHDIK